MTFKYRPRYFSLAVIIVFNLIVFAKIGQCAENIVLLISIILLADVFGIRYGLKNGILEKYVFHVKIREIVVQDIKKIEVVTVKQAGKIYLYIGDQPKETGYYLIMKDGSKIKIYSSYQNVEDITIGKYLITNCKVRYEDIEKLKWFNDLL